MTSPPGQGMPSWLKAILIVVGVIVGLFVLLIGACVALFTVGGTF